MTGERVQDSQQNPAFVQTIMLAPTPTPTVIATPEGIDQDKMVTLEARIRAIEVVNLYEPI